MIWNILTVLENTSVRWPVPCILGGNLLKLGTGNIFAKQATGPHTFLHFVNRHSLEHWAQCALSRKQVPSLIIKHWCIYTAWVLGSIQLMNRGGGGKFHGRLLTWNFHLDTGPCVHVLVKCPDIKILSQLPSFFYPCHKDHSQISSLLSIPIGPL